MSSTTVKLVGVTGDLAEFSVTRSNNTGTNVTVVNTPLPVSVTNTPIPVTGSVTIAPDPVNVNVTNPSIPVTGSVDANITNPSIAVTGSVGITTNPLNVNVTNAGNIPVTPQFDDRYIDAFDRLRVSEPTTIFDQKQLSALANSTFFTTTDLLSGGSTAVYDVNRASTTLNLTIGGGSQNRVRQSKRYFNYQPGKSQLILVTFVMGNVANVGVEKGVGYYNDQNGIFLRKSTSNNIQFVRRTSTTGVPVDTSVNQVDWNVDPMNGTGPSGLTLDWANSQILVLDFEWLGVGSVRCGFVVNGLIYYAHKFLNANILPVVYMSTPDLPVRYQIIGTSINDSLESICCSVISEGGTSFNGFNCSIDRGLVGMTTNNDALYYVVLAVRIRAGFTYCTVKPLNINLICTSTANYHWVLMLNPAISSGTLTYVDELGTALAVARPATTTINPATSDSIFKIASGYVVASGSSVIGETLPDTGQLFLGRSLSGASIVEDQLILAVSRQTGTTETFYASMQLEQII